MHLGVFKCQCKGNMNGPFWSGPLRQPCLNGLRNMLYTVLCILTFHVFIETDCRLQPP